MKFCELVNFIHDCSQIINEQNIFDGLCMQVKDRDVGTDKLLGVTTISLHDLKPDVEEEFTKKLSKSLDTDRVKDKGDRGTISVKVS